jgi:sortase A
MVATPGLVPDPPNLDAMTSPTHEVASPPPEPGETPKGSSAQSKRRFARGAHSRPKSEPLGPLRRGVRELGLALITIGVIILLFVLYQLYGTGVAEAHSQAQLAKQFNAAVSAATSGPTTTSPTSDNPTLGSGSESGGNQAEPSIPPGGAIDHLVIPKIGVNKFVVEGVQLNDLMKGPGHYPETVMPGQAGNAAIAGHRTTYGAPFYDLNELSVGDPIIITDLAGRTFTYRVSQPPRSVSPDDVSVLDPTPYAELTLTTCNPRFEATSRLVVVARLSGQAPLPVVRAAGAPASGAPAVSSPAAATSLTEGESGAWPAALACGAIVLLLWIGVRLCINRTRRWNRVAAYVVGIAICLVPLWFFFENVIRLLPPSI